MWKFAASPPAPDFWSQHQSAICITQQYMPMLAKQQPIIYQLWYMQLVDSVSSLLLSTIPGRPINYDTLPVGV